MCLERVTVLKIQPHQTKYGKKPTNLLYIYLFVWTYMNKMAVNQITTYINTKMDEDYYYFRKKY